MVDLNNLKVQKKDGAMAAYDRIKILASVTKAGATPDQSEQIANGVENWAVSSTNGIVTSAEIRTKIIELLNPVNPTATQTYESYVKPA
jgi:transcriptional regulator NrdR family protein